MSAAASQLAAPWPARPKPDDEWRANVAKRLREFRKAAIRAGTWRGGSKYAACPQPCWKVEHLHSITQHRVYERLQDIGENPQLYDRKIGACAGIVGRKHGEYDYTVEVSVGALAILLGIPRPTCQDALRQLEAKRSLYRLEIRRRPVAGERAPGNRAATVYRLPHARDVLAARRADARIATTHGEEDPKRSLQWNNGRCNSRRLLTAEEAEAWALRTLPARPKAEPYGKSEQELPPAGSTQHDAPRAASGRDAGVRPRTKMPDVPAEVQRGLDELNYGEFFEPAAKVAANLRAMFRAHCGADAEFPDACIVITCHRFLLNAGKKNLPGDCWRWKVDSVTGFLLHCSQDDAATGGRNHEIALRTVDNWSKQHKKAEGVLRDQICEQLGYLRKHPGDPELIAFLADLRAQNPDLYDRTEAEEAKRIAKGAS